MGIAALQLPSVSTSTGDTLRLLRRQCCVRHRQWKGCLTLLLNPEKRTNPICVGLCRCRLLTALYNVMKESMTWYIKEDIRRTFALLSDGSLLHQRYKTDRTEKRRALERIPCFKTETDKKGQVIVSSLFLRSGPFIRWSDDYLDTQVHDLNTLHWSLSLRTTKDDPWLVIRSGTDKDKTQWQALLKHPGLTDEVRSLLTAWRLIDLSQGRDLSQDRLPWCPVARTSDSSFTKMEYKTFLNVNRYEVRLGVQLVVEPSPSIPRPPGQSETWRRLVEAVPISIRPDVVSQWWGWLEPFLHESCE